MPHTPGPWKAEDNCVVARKGLTGVAILEPDPAKDFWSDGGAAVCQPVADHREIQANARLMAAAPDLLAACEALLRLVDASPRQYLYDAALAPVVEQARAAIARAEGT